MGNEYPALLDWRADASCAGLHVSIFYPAPSDHAGTDRAKNICGGCPVRDQCLRYAVTNGLKSGIFGGTTPAERRALARGANGATAR